MELKDYGNYKSYLYIHQCLRGKEVKMKNSFFYSEFLKLGTYAL